MIEWSASVQPLFVGGTLLWSGAIKFAGRSARRSAERSALPSLVGAGRALLAYRLTGALELALAAVLLLPPVYAGEAVAAAVLATGFLGYLVYARISAPDSSCGCMSTRRTPVTGRGFGRAGLLLAAALLGTQADRWWGGGLAAHPWAAGATLLGEVAALVALSPEADRMWLLPLRRLRVRLRHPLADRSFEMPLESSLQQLHRSPAYRRVSGLLRSGLKETWDEQDVRVLCYTAEYEGRRATAVFAVPLRHYRPEEIRGALVDETAESTLLVLAGA
ncbi:MauE/DoxX family redox-associated membrane protein [Actinoallomurus sp. NPDC050550]|uniref:MauE/DoxX family redox-associated membrane protein n=1 Tax=Actinoallomurus sp. NPDC050550 TaxID=3154937 RepID=UPI0033F01CCE